IVLKHVQEQININIEFIMLTLKIEHTHTTLPSSSDTTLISSVLYVMLPFSSVL
ncbi:hypothetical protein L9F63_008540, partial [Diploptera punctata]